MRKLVIVGIVLVASLAYAERPKYTRKQPVVVPGLEREDFDRIAEKAKANCPVSQALAGIEITLEATLA